VISLVTKPSSKVRHPSITLDLRPRLTRVGGWSDPQAGLAGLVQLLILAVATSALAAAVDWLRRHMLGG
jgi:hypothetical protein